MSDHLNKPIWEKYDHLEMAATADPASILTELRAQCPIGRSEQHGGFYVVTRYADCIAAAKSPCLTSSPDRGPGPGFPFSFEILRMGMITDDGERHRDFRLPLAKFFSLKQAAGLEPKIRQICDLAIDSFIERGEADLVTEFTNELPAVLISELLDLPFERRHEIQGWASQMVATADPEFMHKLAGYTEELYELRRRKPGQDIASQMLNFAIQGRPITKDEWRGLVLLLILGGLDTTANGGGFMLQMIAQQDTLRSYLIEHPDRTEQVVKELLRLISPVPQHSRGVIEDVEVGGQMFKKGDVVQLNWLAANHDPEAFENPDTLDPQRKVDHHLAFGTGPHRCLGASLALVEMKVMAQQILTRLPDYRLVEGGVELFPSLNRGMKHLRVTFTPGVRSVTG